MTVSTEQLEKVVATLRALGARRILLFGSFAHAPEHVCDIDLAVEGIPLGCQWRADGEVESVVDVPVDLIFKEEMPVFFSLISKDARVLYEQADHNRGRALSEKGDGAISHP